MGTVGRRFKKRKDVYPKYLYVIYDGMNPVYVGVTYMPVEMRFVRPYRSDFIMKNKKRLTYRVVDTILNADQLYKETDLILYFVSKGIKLENKVYAPGAGIAGYVEKIKHSRYIPKKLNGESEAILTAKRLIRRGVTKKSTLLTRPEKISKIRGMLESGMNIYQISQSMNWDYGNLYRFIKKYVTYQQKP